MKTFRSFSFAGVFFAVLSLLLSGCGLTQGKKDAETVLSRHFQTIATNGFETAMGDYGSQFFQKTKKEDWIKGLAGMNRKLGPYQSHTVTAWRMFKSAGTSAAGTTFLIQCQVTYSKHKATENFTLFKGVVDSEYRIVEHKIDSMALMTE